MKLFKEHEQPEKTFSVNIQESITGDETLYFTLVDSLTEEFIANLCEISENGIYLSRGVKACIEGMGYASDKTKFEDNGSLKIIQH